MSENNFSIQYKDKKFTPSKYQEEIFKNVKYGVGNMIIKACAGSGKTSIIVNLIKLIDNSKKLLFIAFNREIVNELKQRIGLLSNVDIMTYHSLGYLILKENLKLSLKNVDEYKYKTYVKNNLNNISTINVHSFTKPKLSTYIDNIVKLIDYSRYNLSQNVIEINQIANKYGIITIADECEAVEKVLKWGQNNLDTIDYTDMVWLPIELNLYPKKYQYDWVLIDESQDISLIQQKLFLKTFKRNTRFVSVGDEYQTINLWAGASETAISDLEKIPNTKVFYLPITYRCPKIIVNMAKKYSPNIEAKDDAIEGQINFNVSINQPKSGDMILCRNTAPLIELYMKYLEQNKKSYIKGRSIGTNFIDIINETNEVYLYENEFSNGLFNKLYEKLFTIRDRLITQYKLDIYDASLSTQVINFYEAINSLKILSKGLTTTEQLKNKINDIFLDSDGDGVCLSTIHKSKGLEADNIFILCKSLMPSKLAKKEWEITTENNLIYVAITRAKKTLNFISEMEFKPPNYINNPHTFFNKLNEIQKNIGYISNIKKNENIFFYDKENIIDHNINKKNNKPIIKASNKFKKFIN